MKRPPSTHAAAILISALAWILLAALPVPASILHQFGLKVLFYARAAVMPPELDPRIKVFGFEDRTVAKLAAFDVPLESWARVFAAFSARKPAAILIDKLFDNPSYPEADVIAFRLILAERETKPRIVSIAFGSDKPVPFRTPLDPAAVPVELRVDGTKLGGKLRPGTLYGARSELLGALGGIGHALYESPGFVPLAVGQGDVALAHWSFAPAAPFDLSRVPTDAEGRILVDLWRPDFYQSKTYSMEPVFERVRKGKDLSIVNEGDYVVILPAMYTGNSDWRDTAYGPMVGGHIMAAMLNSALQGHWVRHTRLARVFVLLGAALAFAAFGRSQGRVAGFGGLALLALPLLAVAAFCLFGVAFDWAHPTGAAFCFYVVLLHHASREQFAGKLRMEKELETAKLVQGSFFPDRRSALVGLEAEYRASSECSGDWWGNFAGADGSEYVIIADATGHGVGAALITGMTFAVVESVRRMAQEHAGGVSPKRLCEALNEVFCETTAGNATMTCLVARFHPDRATLTICNAGHTIPILLAAAGGPIQPLKGSSNPIGFFRDAEYLEKSHAFRPGDRLVLFTDGLTENAGGFATRELKQVLTAHATADAPALKKLVLERYDAALEKQRAGDDDMMLLVASLR